MILPTSPTRLWLLSFWLVISLLMGTAIGVLLWILISPVWSLIGPVLSALLGITGLMRPRLVTRPYKIWNGIAKKFTRIARLCVAGACFYIIFIAVGRTGANIGLTPPDGNTKTLWFSRSATAGRVDVYEPKATGKESTQTSWIKAFISWAIESRNVWACCLLPFLLLLRTHETEEQSSFPKHIYTLY